MEPLYLLRSFFSLVYSRSHLTSVLISPRSPSPVIIHFKEVISLHAPSAFLYLKTRTHKSSHDLWLLHDVTRCSKPLNARLSHSFHLTSSRTLHRNQFLTYFLPVLLYHNIPRSFITFFFICSGMQKATDCWVLTRLFVTIDQELNLV